MLFSWMSFFGGVRKISGLTFRQLASRVGGSSTTLLAEEIVGEPRLSAGCSLSGTADTVIDNSLD
jgi:hypothetical protein